MEMTTQQLTSIIEMAAHKAVEVYRATEEIKPFPSKAAIAKYLGKSRNTIDAMIDRGQIEVTPQGFFKLAVTIKK